MRVGTTATSGRELRGRERDREREKAKETDNEISEHKEEEKEEERLRSYSLGFEDIYSMAGLDCVRTGAGTFPIQVFLVFKFSCVNFYRSSSVTIHSQFFLFRSFSDVLLSD